MTATGPDTAPAEQIGHVRAEAGSRFEEIELALNVLPVDLAGDGHRDLSVLRTIDPDATDDELLAAPCTLVGRTGQIAGTLRRYRETYGVTYVVVPYQLIEQFAEVIDLLRGEVHARSDPP